MVTPSSTAKWDFTDVHVLITGGSHGIGLATAAAFHEAGATVTITGRRARAEDYETDLSRFRYHQLELSDKPAAAELAGRLDRLDILVNNAGESHPGGADQWAPDNFDTAVEVNLVSLFRLSVACLPKLRESLLPGGACLLGIASLASYFGFPLTPGYGAAKAGVVALTKTMAAHWGRYNIRVNAVAAGTIRTHMGQTDMAESHAGGGDGGSPMLGWERAFHARTPLGRKGDPADVAEPLLFLCSSAARYITGETLMVDGGYSATTWEIPDTDELMRLMGVGLE